jgi:hypothetical protein
MSPTERLASSFRAPLMPALHALLIVGLACGNLVYVSAVAMVASGALASSARAAEPAADLEELVGPIALYPDELLGIVLPASTYPLQIVQAARLLDKLEAEPDLKPDEDWDPSVIGLMNYPEVIQLMNEDLDWTWKLGDAVAKDQSQVMDAVQGFRGKVDRAGNLESNDKMTITRESPEPGDVEVPDGEPEPQIIVIESASPEVIYVPSYQPTTVVVHQTTPYPYYYSRPYPYYYRPAAVFWTGLFVGAAVGWGLSWGWGRYGRGGYHRSSVKVNNNVNVNVNRPTRPSTPNRPGGSKPGNRPGNRPGGGGDWKPDKGPGKPGGGRPGGGTKPATRPAGDKGKAGARPSTGQRPAGGKQPSAGQRPSTGKQPSAGQRPSAGAGNTRPAAGGQRPSTGQAGRPQQGASSRPAAGTSNRASGRDLTSKGASPSSNRGSSMGNYGSGSKSRSAASRGSSSRGSSKGGSRGGSRGGGSRGGGGGRGGGGRR